MMTISSRFFTRAGAATLTALSLAACGDSTSPLAVTPEHLEAMGQAMAVELESGVMQLTAQGAMGNVNAPVYSVQRRSPMSFTGAALNVQRASGHPISFQVVDPQCGVPSQDPPIDSDRDQVPDNLEITFALPACRFSDPSGGTFDLTGVIRVTDPHPGTPGMNFTMAADNFRVTLSNTDFSGYIRRDGLASVAADQTGLSQTVSWLETARISGLPPILVAIDWTATFAAAPGATITPGQPLPDGAFVANGTLQYRQGDAVAQFSVTTVQALQYSAQCAAGVAAGTSPSPFTSGKVRIGVSNEAGRGYAEVTYTNCSAATVVFVAA
jgi:hypothetical protein